MARSLSNLLNNLSKGIHKIKCKCGHSDKKYETCGITFPVYDYFLEYTDFKDDLIKNKCLCCNMNFSANVWWNIKGTIFKYIKIF